MPASSRTIPAWKRPDRPSFVTVLVGNVYVATAKPDGPGYSTRRYVPGEPVDIDPDALDINKVVEEGVRSILRVATP